MEPKLMCPGNDMTCPYWQWGGLCSLETAKEDCDEWYGLEEEEDEETDGSPDGENSED